MWAKLLSRHNWLLFAVLLAWAAFLGYTGLYADQPPLLPPPPSGRQAGRHHHLLLLLPPLLRAHLPPARTASRSHPSDATDSLSSQFPSPSLPPSSSSSSTGSDEEAQGNAATATAGTPPTSTSQPPVPQGIGISGRHGAGVDTPQGGAAAGAHPSHLESGGSDAAAGTTPTDTPLCTTGWDLYRKQRGAPRRVSAPTLSPGVQVSICRALALRVGVGLGVEKDASPTSTSTSTPQRERILTVIPANLAHLSLAVASYCMLRDAVSRGGEDAGGIALMSLDLASFQSLTEGGYPAFPAPAGMGSSGVARQRDSRRIALTLFKLRGVVLLLHWGFTVLCAEADIAYLTNPLPEVLRVLNSPGVDMAFQAEAPFLPSLSGVCTAENPQSVSAEKRGAAGLQCMGVYAARPTELSKSVLDRADGFVLRRAIKSMFRFGGFQAAYLHEQYGLNWVLRMDNSTWDHVGEFDRCKFAHGHDYFKEKAHERLGITPVLVHAVAVSPKDVFLKRVRWISQCNVTDAPSAQPQRLAGQVGWLDDASVTVRVGGAFGLLWQLLFSRTSNSSVRSYAASYHKPWKTLERRESRRRDLGQLCSKLPRNCTYTEG